jgi:ligand-binding sensor domain-containing protein/anti-sigma regulatory factor (Ser/Thr protein kinase)
MNRQWQLIILLWICISPVFGQNGNLIFHHLLGKDGLSEATNSFVYKDRRGFIWISSLSGLNRFDGSRVDHYYTDPRNPTSILGEIIQSSFFEDDTSFLWFNTYDALNAYDWKKDCFRHFQIHSDQISKQDYYTFCLDSCHQLWMLCESQLYTFNVRDTIFHPVGTLIKPSQKAIALRDKKGNVTGIWAYKKNNFGAEMILLDEHDHIRQNKIFWDSTATPALRIRDMAAQGDSIIWALSNRSLLKYNIRQQTTHLIPFARGEAETFEVINDSTLLIGFLDIGMQEYNTKQEKIIFQYTHQPEEELSLASNKVDFISQDRDHGIWVGSSGIGLSYAYPQKKKFNTFYPNLESMGVQEFNPSSFVLDQPETLWCATESNGLYFIHRQDHQHQEIRRVPNSYVNSIEGKVFSSIKDNDGCYWICSAVGLFVCDPVKGIIRQILNEPNVALAAVKMPDGDMLFCGKGLFKVRGDLQHGYTLTWNKAISDTLEYIPIWLDSRGRILINQDLQDLLVLDSADFKKIATLPLKGICNQLLESKDRSTIWICSTTGLFKLNALTLELKKVDFIRSGLIAPGFNSMAMDLSGRLWLTFNQGIIMYDPARDSTRVYTPEDGLPAFQFRKAAYRFDDGEIWFGAMRGITRFYPDQIHDLNITALPQITEIQVNDHVPATKLICDITGAPNVPLIQKLTFNYKNNTLAFRVNALEFSSPQHNKVKYQMEGLDEHLLETTNGSIIRYANLPPDDYRFVVYALNSDGVINSKPHVLMIHIKPPYYKTWWFRILIFLLSTGLLAYIIFLRFSKALELQRVRLKLYENLHDDVGSRLTAIVLSAEDLERNENIHHPKIESISKIAKSIVGNMRRLVWAIDPENDKMNNLIQKITHDKSMILDDALAFNIKVDEHLKNVIVPGEIRYQIISICNEAFNNISKYAQATTVTVILSRENRKFHLTITDNGKGFDPATTSKNAMTGSGYGLNNMKRRASRVKGSLEIFSKPGEGTRIEAYFPY